MFAALYEVDDSAGAKPNLNLQVIILPPNCDDPAFVKTLNDSPGILALAMEEKDGALQAVPFIVPGARFNEKYGWDSVSRQPQITLITVLYGAWTPRGRQD